VAQIVGGALIVGPALFVGRFHFFGFGVGQDVFGGKSVMVFCYILISLVAALLAPTESVRRTRWLHWLLILMAGLPGLFMAGRSLPALQAVKGDLFWFLLFGVQAGMALVPAVGAALLYGRHPDRQELGEQEG
jgi:hypothetical protein